MCYATLSTGSLRYTRNDSRFFVHVSPADFVLAATFAYRSVSLRASVAQRGNTVYFMLRAARKIFIAAEHQRRRMNFELCTLNFEKTRRWRVFYSTQIDATLVGAVAEPTGIWTYAVVALTVVPSLVTLVTYLPAAGLTV